MNSTDAKAIADFLQPVHEMVKTARTLGLRPVGIAVTYEAMRKVVSHPSSLKAVTFLGLPVTVAM